MSCDMNNVVGIMQTGCRAPQHVMGWGFEKKNLIVGCSRSVGNQHDRALHPA